MTQVYGAIPVINVAQNSQTQKKTENYELEQSDSVLSLTHKTIPVDFPIVDTAYRISPIKNHDIPEVPISYCEESKENAYEKYSQMTDKEKKDIHKAYENAINEFEKLHLKEAAVGNLYQITSFEEFLEEHPEYKEAVSIMGPIAADYNDKLEDAIKEYDKNTSWYQKILDAFKIGSNGKDEAIKKAQEEFLKDHPECQSIIEFAKEQNKTILDKLKELFQ